MKRLLLSCCILLCVVLTLKAQEQPLISPDDSIRSLVGRLFPNSNPNLSAHMNLQFSTSGVANFIEGDLEDASFKLNRVKLEILGSFSKQFSYHFRQSFNKQDIALGGYEYYVNAIKVREYSEFNDNISCYQAGVAGRFNLSSTNELVLQVVNNRSGENDETYLYGLPQGVEKAKVPVLSTVNWNGFFFDNAVQLRYADSYGQLAEGKNLCCFTAGNIYEKGPVIAYIDLMYSREGLDSKGIISDLQGPVLTAPSTAQNAEYFSTVVNFDYRVHPNWNLYLKGAYERAGIYKANGHFEKGLYRTTWNAQACVEYFPMRNSELLIFAHLLYKGHHLTRRAQALGSTSPDTQRFSVGLVYSIPVF